MSRIQHSQPIQLEQIIEAVLAVAGGARTPAELAEALAADGPHGRHVRDLAAGLGLLKLDESGQAQVTSRAVRLLGAKDRLQRTARLRYAVRQLPAIAHVLSYLMENPLGCTVRKLEEVLGDEWPHSDTSLEQRVQTAIAWLKEVELISEQNGVVRPTDGLAQQ